MTSLPAPPRQTAVSHRARLATAAACGGAFAIALVRLCGLVADNAVDLPYGDQWDALRPLFNEAGPLACFRQQHGPHRLGAGGLLDWVLYPATGWNVAAESWAGVIVLALAAAAMVSISARLRGRLSWRDASFPLILLSPVSWETILLTPFLAHSILPLLLLLLLAGAWVGAGGAQPSPTRLALVGFLTAILLFSGFGFCGAFASLGLMLIRYLRPTRPGGRTARIWLLPLGLMLAALLCFAIGYRWDPAVPGWRFPVPNWWDYARFPALMFTNLLGWRAINPLSTMAGGTILALCVYAWGRTGRALLRAQGNPRDHAVWFLCTGSLLYAGFTAVGRLPVNIEAAFMWRYTPLMMPALCGLLLALDQPPKSPLTPGVRPSILGMFALVLGILVWRSPVPEHHAAAIAGAKREWIGQYLRTRNLAAANATSGYWVYPPQPDSPEIATRLRWLERHQLSFLRREDVRSPAPSP